ncbi:hypothetical protein [Catellatospora sp. NPDC049133]|uniref:hypothetical protein n=1 Tax=Catellatospora sp. NPDC049133 TaxID=3155499 RepID=UPI0033E254EC
MDRGEAAERDLRREEYVQLCEAIRHTWMAQIAGKRGILPGATLDPIITPRGWVGHVQGTIAQSDLMSDDRPRIAAAIVLAYDLPLGAVLVDDGHRRIPDSLTVWAFRRPGEVDYHQRLPHTVFNQVFAGEEAVPGTLTRLERAELVSWGRKVNAILGAVRRGAEVDMDQVTRRYNRFRGAVLDALSKVDVEQVRELVEQTGLNHRTVGVDIGRLLGMSRD